MRSIFTRLPIFAVPAAAAALLGACDDGLDQRLAIIDAPRVLAILNEPAEARPGEPVTYRAVVAGPGGTLDPVPRWAFCTAPKPPTEDNAVSTQCADGDALEPIGEYTTVATALPADACTRFGPEVPPGDFRPRDPDPTGGFYQPVRAEIAPGGDAPPLVAFGLTRITCKLPNASAELSRAYDLNYVANRTPSFELPAPSPLIVPAHAAVPLTASWPAEAAEPYLYFDQLAQALVMRREVMRLSWFATGGALDVDASASAEDDPSTHVTTIWHTPGPGPATLWFVLRDSRGGIATRSISVTVATTAAIE